MSTGMVEMVRGTQRYFIESRPQGDDVVIPWPMSYAKDEGSFVLDDEVVLDAPPELRDILAREFRGSGPRWAAAGGAGDGSAGGGGVPRRMVLEIDTALPAEGYHLDVTPDLVRVRGGAPAGVFYAIQTLKQLLPPEVYRAAHASRPAWSVPCCRIEDRPAHSWRGCLLDVARYFMPKDFLFRLIDLLALHKLNVLQLHLTDDDGWRVESKRYPRLTQAGAWREETRWWWEERGDGTPHGGFYTQADLAEIVAYAGQRFITVVPEIEMPAHTGAAITAYPELGHHPDAPPRSSIPPDHDDVLNVEDGTLEFFQNVLEEVLEIFPSTFIHIGGDECPKEPWRNSPRAQLRMRELGLADEDELQSWFITQMDSWLTARGRRLVGWDEIGEGGLAPGATVMSWRGQEGGITAARAGHDVVMAPTSPTYLDYYQSESPDEPLAIGGHVPLEAVYAYEPVPAALSDTEASHVLGAQVQLWTGFLPAGPQVEYMAFPRACAFAEAVWRSRRDRPYEEFLERLDNHLHRLDALGVNYRPLSGPLPWQQGGTGRFNRPNQPQMVD
ncbi:beta-N-acetylhexosaminidase [Actinopolymorpha sp. B17G11]|uniref:beta-N-acetylhexosaminidase n=1 Tax=Actinopolymorpha sp. B17G11 TaxID=3160861 RepID=UPI0032E4EBC9